MTLCNYCFRPVATDAQWAEDPDVHQRPETCWGGWANCSPTAMRERILDLLASVDALGLLDHCDEGPGCGQGWASEKLEALRTDIRAVLEAVGRNGDG